MKEIQIWRGDKDCPHASVTYTDHLTAIEEAKNEEQYRMMKFAEWTAEKHLKLPPEIGVTLDEAFQYWQKNVEGK